MCRGWQRLKLRRLSCAVEKGHDPDSRESDQTVVGGGEAAGGAVPARMEGNKSMLVDDHARCIVRSGRGRYG
jgi:hypothetical protein